MSKRPNKLVIKITCYLEGESADAPVPDHLSEIASRATLQVMEPVVGYSDEMAMNELRPLWDPVDGRTEIAFNGHKLVWDDKGGGWMWLTKAKKG